MVTNITTLQVVLKTTGLTAPYPCWVILHKQNATISDAKQERARDLILTQEVWRTKEYKGWKIQIEKD